MRRTPSPYRRIIAGAALLVAAGACSDMATQPGRSTATGARRPRLDLTDSAVADSTIAGPTVADTTVVGVVVGDTGSTPETSPKAAPAGPLDEAQFLVCPTSDEARASDVIGPDGGTIGARGTSITIPPGAVPEPTLFEVVVPASPYMEADIRAVGQEHYQFQAPATVTINYARCPDSAIPAGATLQGVYVDTDTYQVLQQMGGVNDRPAHKLTFSTPHLSGYIVAY